MPKHILITFFGDKVCNISRCVQLYLVFHTRYLLYKKDTITNKQVERWSHERCVISSQSHNKTNIKDKITNI